MVKNYLLTHYKILLKFLLVAIWWGIVAVAVILIDNKMWKEILAYSFVIPILVASYHGKVPGLIFSILSSVVSGSQAVEGFLLFSPFAQRILFQILFINTVALVTTTLAEREKKARLDFQQLFNNVPIGLFRIDDQGVFTKINPVLAGMLGISEVGNIGKYNLKDYFFEEDQFKEIFNNVERDGLIQKLQVLIKKSDGTKVWGEIKCRLRVKEDEFPYQREFDGSLEDISERVRLHEEITDLATYDSLTRVFNRGHFLALAKPVFEQALLTRTPLSILLMDVDQFKKINDSYGHPAGDMVLKDIAASILKNVAPSDIVGRYGGDEFIVLLSNQEDRKAVEVAKKIADHVKGLTFESHHPKSFSVAVSIGISSLNFLQEENMDLLIQQADNAMYQEKKRLRSLLNQ